MLCLDFHWLEIVSVFFSIMYVFFWELTQHLKRTQHVMYLDKVSCVLHYPA